MHPNCRHAFTAYIPGLTKLDENTEDPEGEANRKKLRQLERDVRQTKRQMAGATGAAAQKHEARLKDLQAKIRQHVDSTGVRRSRRREQINLALGDEPTGKVHSDGLLNANTADFRSHNYRLPAKPDKPKISPTALNYDQALARREVAPHDDPDRYYTEASEQATAERLRTLGINPRSIEKQTKQTKQGKQGKQGKNPDAVIDNGRQVVDYKQVGEPTRNAIEAQMQRGKDQCRAVVFDARSSGFTEKDAYAQLARALGNYKASFDQVLFLGPDFQIMWP